MRPLRLLTAIRFNYSLGRENVDVKEVYLQATFFESEEELESNLPDGTFGFQKLILLGAKWDFEE